jgi:hypothetical protein
VKDNEAFRLFLALDPVFSILYNNKNTRQSEAFLVLDPFSSLFSIITKKYEGLP